MAKPGTQKEFREFEKAFNKIRSDKRKERKKEPFTKFLVPDKLRRHIASGKSLLLKYGNVKNDRVVKYKEFKKKGALVGPFGWLEFEIDDLEAFAKALDSSKKGTGQKKGAPVAEILGLSDPQRIKRANQTIATALLYKIRGDTLHFRVSAARDSAENQGGAYQVRVRLEEWGDIRQDPRQRDYVNAARKAALGRVSFDCTCKDHQFVYRYLAGWKNASLTPIERDFPKIRNPQLKGFCCKHTVKALTALKGAVVHQRLANEMKRQAQRGGLSGGRQDIVFLTQKDIEGLEKGAQKKSYLKDVKAAYRQFKKDRKKFIKKKREPKVADEIKRLKVGQKAAEKIAQREKKRADAAEAQLQRQIMIQEMSRHVYPAVLVGGKTKEEAVREFAKKNNIGLDEASEMAKSINV